MQPTKIDNRQEDIFRGRLSNELNPKHEMMILARMIPWSELEVEFADLYPRSVIRKKFPHKTPAREGSKIEL